MILQQKKIIEAFQFFFTLDLHVNTFSDENVGFSDVASGGRKARITQSVYRFTTGWAVRGSNPGRGEIFRSRPDRP